MDFRKRSARPWLLQTDPDDNSAWETLASALKDDDGDLAPKTLRLV
jgi:hypothetical protein